jgi:hypothetical protein
VVLDFSSLKEYMEKGGLVLQKTKCEYCGSTIYAQDIFEKVKSLIG